MNIVFFKQKFKSTILYKMLKFQSYKLDVFCEKHEPYNTYSKSDLRCLKRKMKYAKVMLEMSYKDFWQCRCEQLSYTELCQIVPYIQQKTLWQTINSAASHELLCDKWKTFLHFREYYKRDIILVKDIAHDITVLNSFIKSHPQFIVKPQGMNCGKGIQIMNASVQKNIIDYLSQTYPDGFVAEELIMQDEEFSQFHKQSVNTLRINTINYGSHVEVMWPCLRIGRSNNIVDNAGAGGIFGGIDVSTGKVIAASDEFHHTFEKHPDSGKQIVGFKIPKFEEACEMVKHLATLIPDCHFVGWDLALTNNGWIMVEANYGPLLIYQIAIGKGIKNEFNKMKNDCKPFYNLRK